MEITGKLINIVTADHPTMKTYPIYKDNGELLSRIAIDDKVTIKLPEVDVSKINERDEVLVRCKLRDVKYSQKMVIAMAMCLDDVVYILPQQPKPMQNPCTLCGQLVCACQMQYQPKPDFDHNPGNDKHIERDKPKVKLPEKFESKDGYYVMTDTGKIYGKIDAIIDYLKTKEGEK